MVNESESSTNSDPINWHKQDLLGVHVAGDVAGGFSAGLVWLAAVILIHKRIYKTYCDINVQNCSNQE